MTLSFDQSCMTLSVTDLDVEGTFELDFVSMDSSAEGGLEVAAAFSRRALTATLTGISCDDGAVPFDPFFVHPASYGDVLWPVTSGDECLEIFCIDADSEAVVVKSGRGRENVLDSYTQVVYVLSQGFSGAIWVQVPNEKDFFACQVLDRGNSLHPDQCPGASNNPHDGWLR